MADETDIASDRAHIEKERMLTCAYAKAAVPIPIEYECRECGAETKGARWCSGPCRDQWCRKAGI